MNELTLLYHTREELAVMRDLVQRAIDADDPTGFTMLNSLRTMFAEAIEGAQEVPVLVASMRLTLHDLSHLIAITTGAAGRVQHAGGAEVAQQLYDLRQRLINTDRQLRQDVGLPTD